MSKRADRLRHERLTGHPAPLRDRFIEYTMEEVLPMIAVIVFFILTGLLLGWLTPDEWFR